MAEQTDDQRAAEPVALAVNPDTGIVHRRMSDGTWYALDAIPGRGAVTGENLLPYLPQTEDDLMMKMHCPCITKSCYHPPAKCSGLPDTKIEMHSSVLGCWQQWTFCRGCAEVAEARWPGEARIVEAAPTGAPTVEQVAKAAAWLAVAALILAGAAAAARGETR